MVKASDVIRSFTTFLADELPNDTPVTLVTKDELAVDDKGQFINAEGVNIVIANLGPDPVCNAISKQAIDIILYVCGSDDLDTIDLIEDVKSAIDVGSCPLYLYNAENPDGLIIPGSLVSWIVEINRGFMNEAIRSNSFWRGSITLRYNQ